MNFIKILFNAIINTSQKTTKKNLLKSVELNTAACSEDHAQDLNYLLGTKQKAFKFGLCGQYINQTA
jgi:hypothetical protein